MTLFKTISMKKSIKNVIVVLITAFSFTFAGLGQAKQDIVAGIPVNYDESKAGNYALPDPLKFSDGKTVRSAREWYNKRRPQIVSLFEEFEYRKLPPAPAKLSYKVFDNGTSALNGKAIRKQVTIYFTKDTGDHKMDLLIYLPAGASKPVPVFFNVGFSPNASVVDDPGVRLGLMWGRDGKKVPVQRRGGFGRMDVDQFLSQGIGFATVCYGDIEPDFADGIKYGLRSLYLKDGQTYPAADEWGAISAWSWGLSRAMDYFEKDPQIDSKKIALFGVSRLGKTVLWTGARDARYGMVIASCGGEGGAAISRRLYGETIDHMTHPTRYFYQFAGNWRNFREDPSKSPVDGHMLVALMAPRPLLLQTGDTDNWSDPKGEFIAAVEGGKVYEFLGKKSLGTDNWPAAGEPILNDLGYFMHKGGHGALPSDYPVFIKFMKMHF
jgi:hypothetical protein